MEPPTPIFVFTDSLSVHRSLGEAAAYHEHRETLRAFDEHGRVFEIPPFADPIPLPGDSRKELVRRLRREVVSLAISRPDLLKMGKWEVKHAADDEIIRLAVRWFSIPEPSGRSLAVARIVTVLLSPFLAVLFVLFYVMLLSGLALVGAKRVFGGGRRAG
jgi:hypothetical protein